MPGIKDLYGKKKQKSSNMIRYLFFLVILAWIGCKTYSYQPVNIDGQIYEVPNPPNTIKVADNLFIERFESSIEDYRGYLTWLEDLYGQESKAYLSAFPKMAMKGHPTYYKPFAEQFNSAAFLKQPMVGISYEQVVAFAKWKTDRVNELILWEKGILKSPNMADAEPRALLPYFKGQYASNKKGEIPLVYYRLPRQREWEMAIRLVLAEKELVSRKTKRYRRAVDAGSEESIVHLFDNVSEMLQEKNQCIGGNAQNNQTTEISNYDQPTKWLGFRLFVEYKGTFDKSQVAPLKKGDKSRN